MSTALGDWNDLESEDNANDVFTNSETGMALPTLPTPRLNSFGIQANSAGQRLNAYQRTVGPSSGQAIGWLVRSHLTRNPRIGICEPLN